MCCGAKTIIYKHLKGPYVPQGDFVSCRVNHFGPLVVGEINYGIVRPGVIIKIPRDLLPDVSHLVSVYKKSTPPSNASLDEAGPRARFAFFPRERYGYLSTGARVQAWRFYYLPIKLAASANFPYELVPSDATRIGSRLAGWFRTLGFREKPGCSCKRIRQMLDEANVDFARRHLPEITAQIVKSAEGLGINAPAPIVSRMLRIAVWKEQRRLVA